MLSQALYSFYGKGHSSESIMKNEVSPTDLGRKEAILHAIDERGSITAHEISDQFDISLPTVRRELEELARQGRIERLHGGARSLKRATPEPPVRQRLPEQIREKRAIGALAAGLIKDGETVFLGSGTSVAEVAYCLKERRSLTVITNSLLVVDILSTMPDITIVVPGGVLRAGESSLIGHLTELSLGELRADKVVVGVRAIDIAVGLTNDYLPETVTDRIILKIGREVILVADHTKCGRVSTSFLAPITSIHTLVTDHLTPRAFIETVRKQGIQVHVAK